MRALVTGGGGFIGSAITRRLLEEGHDVRVVDNFLTGSRDRIPDGAQLVEGDLRDIEAAREATEGRDFVFHQAALRSVPKSVEEPVLSAECNILGTLNVLLAAEGAGVRRVVYASSSSVYGDDAPVPNREDQTPAPASPYAASKLAGEQYCRVWTKIKGLSTVSLRYFNVFGPGQNPESKYSAVFPAFISALIGGEAPEVHWDGEQTRDFTFIDDVVAANLRAAEAEGVEGEVFNIGGGEPKSVNEVLNAVSEALDIWIEPTRTPRRAGDVRHTHADMSRSQEVLRWTPRTAWEDAVARTVDWFRLGAS